MSEGGDVRGGYDVRGGLTWAGGSMPREVGPTAPPPSSSHLINVLTNIIIDTIIN